MPSTTFVIIRWRCSPAYARRSRQCIAEFDPERLQEEFDRQPCKGALISMPAKMRYWECMREKVNGIVKDADTSFRELFGRRVRPRAKSSSSASSERDRDHSR